MVQRFVSHASHEVRIAADNLVVRICKHLQQKVDHLLNVINIQVLVAKPINIENPNVAVYSWRHGRKDIIFDEQDVLLLLHRCQGSKLPVSTARVNDRPAISVSSNNAASSMSEIINFLPSNCVTTKFVPHRLRYDQKIKGALHVKFAC